MLTRRAFATGACCTAHAGLLRAQESAMKPRAWLCTAIDPPPQPGFSVQNYAASTGGHAKDLIRAQAEFKLTDYGTQLLARRWRQSDGLTPNTGVITLGVAFLDSDPASAAIVRSAAPRWLDGPTIGPLNTSLKDRIAFRFDVAPEKAQIRIRFNPALGNNSYIGRVNLDVLKSQHTMNLQNVYDYIVFHEFGHALGLEHEQASPAGTIVWNEQAVINDLSKPPNNWSEDYIRKNVLNRFSSEYACVGDPGFNVNSIMLYQISPTWTKNGFVSPLNTSISERDYKCLAAVYRG